MTGSNGAGSTGFENVLPPSDRFRIELDGVAAGAFASPWAGGYVLATGRGRVEVDVQTTFDFDEVTIRPLRLAVAVERRSPRRICFALEAPACVSVEFDGDIRQPLLILLDDPTLDQPPQGEGELITFEPGRIHDVGTLELQSGQRLWIPRGAVVRGVVRAQGQERLAIGGLGVLDGSQYEGREEARISGRSRPRMIHLIDCRDVTVRGVTLLDSPTWNVVPVGCQRVEVDRIKILNDRVNGDGVDVVGSCDVHIHDCFFRTADDCIAIKAKDVGSPLGEQDVERVTCERLTCWNALPGNALEIGYETRCERIRDIVFRDIDIIHCEWEGYASGGALTIHNGDRAAISDVLYEDIRIEDVQQKVIDFKITLDQYSRDDERGELGNIRIRNLAVVDGPLPPSILQGCRGRHIKTITIEGFTHRGQPLLDTFDARMVVERAYPISFR